MDETLLNHQWAKAVIISLLLKSFIWKESIYFHLLPGNNLITVLLSFTWNTCQSRKQYNNMHKINLVLLPSRLQTQMKWPAWDFTRSTELNWALKPAFHFEKHLPVSIFAFLGSGSLLSFTECWALWCPAQYKCLRSHYSNMSISQEWASLPRGSPQCIPIGRIALSRLCHQRKCSDSKRLDAKTK